MVDLTRLPAGVTRAMTGIAVIGFVIAVGVHLATFGPLSWAPWISGTWPLLFFAIFPVAGSAIVVLSFARVPVDVLLGALPAPIKIAGALLTAYVFINFAIFFRTTFGHAPSAMAVARGFTGHTLFFFAAAAIIWYEFDRIRAMMERIAEISGDESELGDDCAIIPLGSRTLAVSIDASLEGVHFRTEWLDFKEIGFRSAGAALSDLAADGATPFGLMVSLGVPDRGNAKGADPAAEIMAGIATMANNVESHILGGDLTRAERYSVDVCVLGTVDRPVRRTGAREGDALWVTGYLGGAVATHVRIGEAFVVPLVLGVMVWVGLYLRDPKVRAISPIFG